MESQELGFLFSLLAVCGILITSFSVAYGLWSQFHPISYYISLHAIYISAAGIGLFVHWASMFRSRKESKLWNVL